MRTADPLRNNSIVWLRSPSQVKQDANAGSMMNNAQILISYKLDEKSEPSMWKFFT